MGFLDKANKVKQFSDTGEEPVTQGVQHHVNSVDAMPQSQFSGKANPDDIIGTGTVETNSTPVTAYNVADDIVTADVTEELTPAVQPHQETTKYGFDTNTHEDTTPVASTVETKPTETTTSKNQNTSVEKTTQTPKQGAQRVRGVDVRRVLRVSNKLKSLEHDMLVRVLSFFNITDVTDTPEAHETHVEAVISYDPNIRTVLKNFQSVTGLDSDVWAAIRTLRLPLSEAWDLYDLFSALTTSDEKNKPEDLDGIAFQVAKMTKDLDEDARTSVQIVEELFTIVDDNK